MEANFHPQSSTEGLAPKDSANRRGWGRQERRDEGGGTTGGYSPLYMEHVLFEKMYMEKGSKEEKRQARLRNPASSQLHMALGREGPSK